MDWSEVDHDAVLRAAAQPFVVPAVNGELLAVFGAGVAREGDGWRASSVTLARPDDLYPERRTAFGTLWLESPLDGHDARRRHGTAQAWFADDGLEPQGDALVDEDEAPRAFGWDETTLDVDGVRITGFRRGGPTREGFYALIRPDLIATIARPLTPEEPPALRVETDWSTVQTLET